MYSTDWNFGYRTPRCSNFRKFFFPIYTYKQSPYASLQAFWLFGLVASNPRLTHEKARLGHGQIFQFHYIQHSRHLGAILLYLLVFAFPYRDQEKNYCPPFFPCSSSEYIWQIGAAVKRAWSAECSLQIIPALSLLYAAAMASATLGTAIIQTCGKRPVWSGSCMRT